MRCGRKTFLKCLEKRIKFYMYVGAQDKTGCYYNGDASKDHERNGISLNGMNRSHVTRNLKGKFSYAGCEIMKMR